MSTRSRRPKRSRAPSESGAPKRSYRPPRLVRYGTIVELTQSNVLKDGPNDRALPGMIGWLKSVV
ncbi:MAG: lasso RiPP family leader peptide-containing protein [Deltaproteobacteria bacterium]|nr:MAG: lasso RiPP family leader peptide-containing protein [Deltaproteobacteria bacterium]